MEWQRFLEENNIHFVTRGPNTKRGEVSIHCPMCGEDDPSEHLGINLKTGHWGCLRDQSHRGKSPRTLVKAILGCSSMQAGHIVQQYSHSDPDTLDAALEFLQNGEFMTEDETQKAKSQKSCEPEFEDFYRIKSHGITKRFFQYLQGRGYSDPQGIIERYDLRCALTGRYKDRVIVPVRMNGELLGWTSRAIGKPVNAPRYLASNEEIKTVVWNYDELKKGGKRLFIVEGPFDAIRVDNYGQSENIRFVDVEYRATCTFGTSVVVSQYALLRNLTKLYDEVFVLFDRGAEGPAAELASWIGADVTHLPTNIDDPGELLNMHLARMAFKNFREYWSYL